MESRLSMDRSYLLNLCAFAEKKARTYGKMIEYSLVEKDRETLALQELRGVRECLVRALALAERILNEAGVDEQYWH